MEVKEALELVDNLVHAKTGKHLNDLERQVFIGSWQGQTYEQIYPLNPEYVEKYVGYKLWQKLSQVLGEKVTKKKFRGAIERGAERQTKQERKKVSRVFISYRSLELDFNLAAQFYEAILAAGHQAFMANVAAGQQCDPDWLTKIDLQLDQCDYFLLLLSPQAAVSEMVIEELRRAKELRDSRPNPKPIVLQLRINCPANLELNHDLRSYLHGNRKREWFSAKDTPFIIQETIDLLVKNREWGVESREESENEINLPSQDMSLILYHEKAETISISKIPSPSPVGEPELPNGQVRLASTFYIERFPHENQCYKAIVQPGALIRIKAPRQMGKTSLMARVLYQAKEQGYRTVPLSFQHADTAVFTNLNELLRWFCTKISRKLKLPNQVDDYWTDTYGSKDNCTAYFEDCLLPQINSPLVLGLDEVDRVFQYPNIADDFFGLLRAWYEEAGYSDSDSFLWEKLRLVVVHSTEVYIPLNVNQSPFNVGLPIELSEFSQQQVCDLSLRHGLDWQTSQIDRLMSIIGGHPYLIRVALYELAQQQISLEELLKIAPTEAGIYGDHLRRHLWNLQEHPELATAFAKVVTAKEPVELESVLAFKLHSLGLVELRGNEVKPRFELYRQYFSDRLVVK